ncbi:MAG: hypothetical protein H6619_01585 [Deltaproteobacteria bacterium]|nr:hypothetical protein [Deltaproteobacteria bacterium]
MTGGDASSADEISSDKKDSKKSDQKDSKDSKDSSDDKKDFGTGGEATPVPYTATKTDGPDTDGDGEGYKAATPSPYTPPSVGDYGSTSGASGNLGQASSSQGSSANQGADDFTSLHGDEADKKNEVNDSKGDSTSGADKSAQASSSDDTSDDTTSSVVVIGPSHSSLHGGFNQAGF